MKEALDALIETARAETFIVPTDGTMDEAHGVMISQYTDWDCNRVLDIMLAALEDSNWHSMVALIEAARDLDNEKIRALTASID